MKWMRTKPNYSQNKSKCLRPISKIYISVILLVSRRQLLNNSFTLPMDWKLESWIPKSFTVENFFHLFIAVRNSSGARELQNISFAYNQKVYLTSKRNVIWICWYSFSLKGVQHKRKQKLYQNSYMFFNRNGKIIKSTKHCVEFSKDKNGNNIVYCLPAVYGRSKIMKRQTLIELGKNL